MENELRTNLLNCAVAYAAKKKVGLSTLGRIAAGDWRFFDNLSKDDKTFTARKYDEVIRWFSSNWPDGLEWPENVPLVAPATEQGAA